MTGQEWLQYFLADQQKKRKGDWIDWAGTGLGAGVGFLVGGPVGALAGSQIGSAVGDTAEGAVNKDLTPGQLVGNAAKAYGGYQAMQTPKTPITPQKAVPNPPLPDPFAPEQGWLGPNADMLRFLQGGGALGFAAGGVVPGFPDTAPMLDPANARLLEMLSASQAQDPYAGRSAEDIVGPAPQMPQFAQAKHPGWEAAAQVLGEVLGKLPGPRQTASSNKTVGAYMPALGAGLSGIANVAANRREGENKTLREDYLNKSKEYERGLTDVRTALIRRKMGLEGGANDDAALADAVELELVGAPSHIKTKGQLKAYIAKKARDASNLNMLFDNMKQLPDIGKFPDIRDAYQKVAAMAAGGTGVSDMSLVFQYMRILDPTSTVREGEYARAEQTASIPQYIVNMYNKALRGDFLSPEQRKDFVRNAKIMYGLKANTYRKGMATLRMQANALGVDPSIVMPNYEVDAGWDPGAPSENVPAGDDNVDENGLLKPDGKMGGEVRPR